MEVKFCLLWGIQAVLAGVRQAKNRLKISQSIGFGRGNSPQPQKNIKEMSIDTVMSGHIVRYLVYVRVCYLLLGWWYLTLTACNQMVMGKPRKKDKNVKKHDP